MSARVKSITRTHQQVVLSLGIMAEDPQDFFDFENDGADFQMVGFPRL
jgi:hypothetical protein